MVFTKLRKWQISGIFFIGIIAVVGIYFIYTSNTNSAPDGESILILENTYRIKALLVYLGVFTSVVCF